MWCTISSNFLFEKKESPQFPKASLFYGQCSAFTRLTISQSSLPFFSDHVFVSLCNYIYIVWTQCPWTLDFLLFESWFKLNAFFVLIISFNSSYEKKINKHLYLLTRLFLRNRQNVFCSFLLGFILLLMVGPSTICLVLSVWSSELNWCEVSR